MRVLITGVSGAGGSYLAEHARSERAEVHGLVRRATSHVPGLTFHNGDLLDPLSLGLVLEAARPDVVFHLASIASVPRSWEAPGSVLAANVLGTTHLLEAVRRGRQPYPVVVLAGTSAMYGNPVTSPVSEEAPLAPVSPYGASKAAQDHLGAAYAVGVGIPVIRARIFGYVSPRRPDLVCTAFARQMALAERGGPLEIRHGNLDSIRTFMDARDVVRALWVLAQRAPPGAYNVGSTEIASVRLVLNRLMAKSRAGLVAKLDSTLMRNGDVTNQIPNVARLIAATGFTPRYSLEESLSWLLVDARARAEAFASSTWDES